MLESRYNNAERTASNPPTIAFLRDCNGYKQCPGVNASVRVWDAIFSAIFKPRPPNVRHKRSGTVGDGKHGTARSQNAQ